MIDIALPKGRLGERAYGLFERCGRGCEEIRAPGRRLVFENPQAGVRFFWVKPSDVPIYVERGAADLGVAGKDVLLEHSPDVYELLDLGIGRCAMCVAGPKGWRAPEGATLRVATKFPGIARRHYAQSGRAIDVIKLKEYAPDELISRELLLIKVNAAAQNRGEIAELARLAGGKVCDITRSSMTIEYCDTPDRVENFLELCRTYGIKRVVRTGAAAIEKGQHPLSLDE